MNKLIRFFYMRTEEVLHSEKDATKLKQDLDSVTCFNTSILTVNKDREKYLFFPANKTFPNDNRYIPSLKACGFSSSTILPVFEFRITPAEDPKKSDLRIKANPYPPFQIMMLIILVPMLLFGILMLASAIMTPNFRNILYAIALIAMPIFFLWLGFWLPYNRTMEKLEWLVKSDLEEEHQKEQNLEKVLKEYDRLAGINEENGSVS